MRVDSHNFCGQVGCGRLDGNWIVFADILVVVFAYHVSDLLACLPSLNLVIIHALSLIPTNRWFLSLPPPSTGGDSSVVNPMVSNMAPAYNAAKYELVWISTSRIRGTHC